jgi:hypothetical protein
MIESPPAPTTTPIEVVSPIKPSEAIRLGCLIAPVQAFDDYGTGTKGCVMRALHLGLGMDRGWGIAEPLPADSPCPVRDCPGSGALLHLNDDHHFSREWIADWLEGQGL